MSKVCADCPKPIQPESKRCKSCAARHKYRDPAAREKMRQAKLRSLAENPEQLAHLKEVGRAQLVKVHARMQAVGWPKRGISLRVPEDRRAEFDKLRRRFGSKEALRIILEDIAAQQRRVGSSSAVSPRPAQPARQPMSFDEQLARVAAGAKLVPTFKYRRPDPEMTLGGVAPEAF